MLRCLNYSNYHMPTDYPANCTATSNDPHDCMDPAYLAHYATNHPRHADLVSLAGHIFNKTCINTLDTLCQDVLKQAYAEVIDMPRTGRWSLQQLEKTEKTYIGTKVEILIRNKLGLARGKKLDLLVAGHEVDIKNTVRSSWEIPREAHGEICLLVKSNEKKGRYSVGLFRAELEYLREGKNQDGKRSIKSPVGTRQILWLLKDRPMAPNFLLELSEADRSTILSAKTASERLRRLFKQHLGRPIHRDIITDIAMQKDAQRRVRANGGARDLLAKDAIMLYSGKTDGAALAAVHDVIIGADYYVAVRSKASISAIPIDQPVVTG